MAQIRKNEGDFKFGNHDPLCFCPMNVPLINKDKTIAAWLSNWQDELSFLRRLSDKTLIAYDRDVEQMLSFFTTHFGAPVSAKTLK